MARDLHARPHNQKASRDASCFRPTIKRAHVARLRFEWRSVDIAGVLDLRQLFPDKMPLDSSLCFFSLVIGSDMPILNWMRRGPRHTDSTFMEYYMTGARLWWVRLDCSAGCSELAVSNRSSEQATFWVRPHQRALS
jgi:hypothetical protein